jgi:pimeloyl-ACP methyl ester carboxylesterase
MNAQIEVTELAKQVRVPTLVLHCTGDRVAPLEEGRHMAKIIPGASFIELPGNAHALLALAATPAFDLFLEEATSFVAAHAR